MAALLSACGSTGFSSSGITEHDTLSVSSETNEKWNEQAMKARCSEYVEMFRNGQFDNFYAHVTNGLKAQLPQDALAVRFAREDSRVDQKSIYLIGHSQGGMFAPVFAKENPEIQGIVSLGGNTSAYEKERILYLLSLRTLLAAPSLLYARLVCGFAFAFGVENELTWRPLCQITVTHKLCTAYS